MANSVIGKILSIGKAVNVSKTSEFLKREIVLDCSRYDRYSGEKRENYVKLSFTQKNCEKLDAFKEGDMVEVSFAINGRKWDKDGTTVIIMDIEGYDIALKSAKTAPQGDKGGEPVPTSQEQSKAPQGEDNGEQSQGDLPF